MRSIVSIIRSKPVILITTSSSIVTMSIASTTTRHQYQRQQQQQLQKQEQQQQKQQMVILRLTWASFSKARSSISISQRFELSSGSTPDNSILKIPAEGCLYEKTLIKNYNLRHMNAKWPNYKRNSGQTNKELVTKLLEEKKNIFWQCIIIETQMDCMPYQ